MKDDSFRKYLFISLAGAVGIILCIVFFFALFRFKQVMEGIRTLESILMPFIYGAVIAYLLTPVCNFVEIRLNALLTGRMKVNEQKAARFSAAIGIGLSLLFGFFIVYLLLAMVLPQVFESVRGIVQVLPGNVVKWSDWIQQKLADDEVLANYAEQFINAAYQNMQVWLNTKFLPDMQVIVSGVSAGLISALAAVKNIVIGIFAAAYLMGNRKKFAAQGKKLIYSFAKVPVANGILDEIHYINRVFGGFIDGKLLDSLIMGILCFVIMNLLNMPYTMLISVIVGVTNIIPFFGPFIGAIPSALIILTDSPVKCVYFLILILVLQQFDGNFLGPKILGDSTGLSSFWVLFSILLFGGLMGFVGMVIGVPTFAVIYDLIKKYSNWMLRKKKLATDTSVYEELSSIEPDGEGYRYIHALTGEARQSRRDMH
ncbi:MAG: AI-2E family transporter [Lachnospiraceae bacterium]|uniref:AI-2E family transporter n=1 Tax=Candidatus Merdisoma sp. JLR.KK011 TaxID=3114299 RepID=UPI0014352F7F|nr:AI-2E family transporter [Lachnospiraceae bacterium]MCI9250598.1 AI-2E family transporter [Lachnospiraceae bacterium]MCI9382971.1 AI-2E family transporter [Lachnospiraceae bacterium]MCI9479127.1 AI-2E family transporter [Lachnospiraceae bacterium]MCI9623606.1 AI-2E family transporter [Lachnospiraceae bacterium]